MVLAERHAAQGHVHAHPQSAAGAALVAAAACATTATATATANMDGPGRNGRRSRGPSPNNGHQHPPQSQGQGQHHQDSSSEDENAEKIRVGRDYQAVCPDIVVAEERKPDQIPDRALLVWSPTIDIEDKKLDEYITVAKEKYGYNGEQALGMLFWHKYDLERAVLDLANFTPFPDEWTVEDKVLFEQAFQFHGKSFHRIRQMLPDKSIASLVKYYYSWKKTRARTSAMDRTATVRREGSPDRASDRASEGHESDPEEKVIEDGGGWCTVCGILCNKTTQYNTHKLCNACYSHARRTGSMRPVCGPVSRRGGPKQGRFKHKLPKGIYMNYDDLVAMGSLSEPATESSDTPNENGASGLNRGEMMLKAMDREIVSLKRQVQTNKQQISALKRKNSESIDDLRPGEVNAKVNSRWTDDELLLAVQGVRKYGKDFQAIADTIKTKTEAHVRTFWANYRRRYNLDVVLKEWEAERGSEGGSASTNPSSPNDVKPDLNNGTSANDDDMDNANNGNGGSQSGGSPQFAGDDKMEVDTDGVALGSIAEQGASQTTPMKPLAKSVK